jgi:hypothetical protein
MSTELRHEIEIDAPPAAVWAVLTDTAAYPEWNPFVRRLDGDLREGARLEVEIAPPGGRAMTFRPTVVALEDGVELRWLGRLLLPGLFDGEHRFLVEPLPGGRTLLVQAERFRGLLVRPLAGALRKTAAGFAQMDEALKARAEALPSAG